MYSLIMMTAMTTAPNGPEFNGYFCDLLSRNGCCGGTSQSAGCCGGAPFGSRIRNFFSFGGGSCTGCCGGTAAKSSCSGSGYSSCCGGSVVMSSCCGGGLPAGAMPMDGGSPYATPNAAYFYPPVVNTYSYPPVTVPSITPVYTVPTVPAPEVRNNQLPLPAGPATSRATVVVRLPADAKLYAEGQPLELTSGERTFYTPDLPAGREYAYSFKIEYTRNGRTLSETQRVNVQAGRTAAVLFDDLTLAAKPKAETAVAAKPEEPAKPVSTEKEGSVRATVETPTPAKITVKLPATSTLYIDGRKSDKAGTERQFTTPPLPAGKEFSYAMKLQLVRNGQPEEITQKVVFQAGEMVTVDFTEMAGERRAGK